MLGTPENHQNQAAKLRDEKACSDLCKFSFQSRNRRKNNSIDFHQKYELQQLRALRKILNLFHSNMQARYQLLIKFCQRKIVKVTYA